MIVTIDGPAGSGKSTTAKSVARELSFGYLDSGALYRTVALKWLRSHSASQTDKVVASSGMDSETRVGEQLCALLKELDLSVRADAVGSLYFELDGEDVSGRIRDEEVGTAASVVSGHQAVRDYVTDIQRRFAMKLENDGVGVVVEGRDIGTVVFPSADFKFFLDARPEVRAVRRVGELRAKGVDVDYQDVLDQIRARDARDRNRSIAPLLPAHDAVVLDTSDLTAAAIVEVIAAAVAKRQS